MEIVVRYELSSAKKYDGVVKKIIEHAAKNVKYPSGTAVSVSFVGDEKMRAFNSQYRGKDRTTNVLAFGTTKERKNKRTKEQSSSLVHKSLRSSVDLGDIFISLPEAKREAKKCGWTMNYEIARLALHGFLHLLEYDHVQEKEARKMEKIEAKVLEELT
ncbi:rRNA maturation RNase YbeY [Candidatus Uhrbacteria bacterium]|nr:rRNA maturation RNase YbeY [Candidatus Uhrbacteria bacterium]